MSKNNHEFSAIAYRWLNSKQTELKLSSIVRYKSIIKNHLEAELGNCSIDKITAQKVEKYIKILQKKNEDEKRPALATIRIIVTVTKAIFRYARESEGVKTADLSKIKVKSGKKEMRILSVAEQKKIEKYCEEDQSRKSIGVILCLYTGIRIGELCALKWKDIDLEERVIHVNRTVYRIQDLSDKGEKKTMIVETAPKSESSIRDVALPKRLCSMLSKIKTARESYVLSGSEKIIEPRRMQYYFTGLAKKTNIVKIKFHSLRHTFATRYIECGMDVKTLSEMLGHSSVQITLDRYVHPTMEMKKKNMEIFAEKMRESIKNVA